MPLWAMWFPSVGTFGIVLAIIGSRVSLLNFTAWKRIGLAVVFVLLGMGEILSLYRADRSHEIEARNQHNDIQNLTEELHKSEAQRQVENATLRTRLEDYAGLSHLGPALMALAQTSAKFQKKQYETKIINDRDLYDLTMKVVKKIRDFSLKYTELEERRRQASSSLSSGLDSEKEQQQKWSDEINKKLQMYRTKQAEFQISILPDAIYARNELLRSKLPEPLLKPSERTDLNVAFKGMVAGINPEMSLATYLEVWVKPLARK